MPLRFDETAIEGVLPFDGYFEIGDRSPEEIADAILKRLSGTSIPLKYPANAPEHFGLPLTSGLFLGRREILEQLDAAWTSPITKLVSIVASGGVGKTSLAKAWLDTLKEKSNHGARAFFSYSFYDQGTQAECENREPRSAGEQFLVTALEWFGDPLPDTGSLTSKADRLASLLQRKRTLLILDGLEPLQHQISEFRGRISDNGIHHLLRNIARNNSGLCVIRV